MDIDKLSPDEGAGRDCDQDSEEPGRSEHAAWGEFLEGHRNRLRRMVALRLDERLKRRIDPSDVIQEAFLEATERRVEYAREAEPMSPFLWLRFLTLQRLQIAHRRHLGTRARDAGREISIHGVASPRGVLGRDRGPAPRPGDPG
jgi:RNA polymerase sigma-70 factor, ECF subfamily